MKLSEAQVAHYHEDGFLVMPSFLDGATLATLRAAYDDVLDGVTPAAGDRMLGGLTRQVMIPSAAHPAFDRNPAVKAAMDVARQLLEAETVFRTFDMLIYKPPGHPHDTPWHQDMSYAAQPFADAGVPIPLGTLQFWVALDDVDVENGCMHFVPGHHRQPLLPHRVAAGDPSYEGRLLAIVDPDADLDLAAAVAAEIPAGGATVHSYGTPHYTPPNRSTDRPRRAYIFNIASAAR